jgi:ADP-ribose pyrophosphatase YjhB (NUDIX family)
MVAIVLPVASPLEDGTMLGSAVIIALAVGASVAAFQVSFADRQETELRRKLPKPAGAPSHAGGVVYEVSGDAVRYLLIRPKSGQAEWVLPQGHIEPGEDHTAAALREVREEAGVAAAVLGLVGHIQFERRGRIQHSKFYLMRKLVQLDPGEDRGSGWFPYDEAMQRLSHPESRSILNNAHERVMALPPTLRA